MVIIILVYFDDANKLDGSGYDDQDVEDLVRATKDIETARLKSFGHTCLENIVSTKWLFEIEIEFVLEISTYNVNQGS